MTGNANIVINRTPHAANDLHAVEDLMQQIKTLCMEISTLDKILPA